MSPARCRRPGGMWPPGPTRTSAAGAEGSVRRLPGGSSDCWAAAVFEHGRPWAWQHPSMDAATFEAAGLYEPEAPTAPDRLAMLQFLDRRGATVAQMVAADA